MQTSNVPGPKTDKRARSPVHCEERCTKKDRTMTTRELLTLYSHGLIPTYLQRPKAMGKCNNPIKSAEDWYSLTTCSLILFVIVSIGTATMIGFNPAPHIMASLSGATFGTCAIWLICEISGRRNKFGGKLDDLRRALGLDWVSFSSMNPSSIYDHVSSCLRAYASVLRLMEKTAGPTSNVANDARLKYKQSLDLCLMFCIANEKENVYFDDEVVKKVRLESGPAQSPRSPVSAT